MDMLSLNALMEQTKMIEDISASVTDDQDYNVMTQRSNVVMESVDDVNGILSRGNDINNVIDFSDLENAVSGLTECNNTNLGTQVSNKMKENMKDPKANPIVKPSAPKAPIQEASASNPSAGVTSANAFMNATPIKQTEFVTAKTAAKVSTELEKANTASELPVTEHKNDKVVDTQADKAMNQMRKDADDKKKWEEVSKKQTKLCNNSAKFESFMESMKTDDNKVLVESFTKAFNVLIKKHI